ncbi:hypothetical protein LZQ00_09225 [Sphingobacterium sp. SRCM116780]|uniref:hypothetical protein n=1 Tax=Sphingobacterium sp. SRCM116780 TaxID=2907623 RepID=UPI001F276CBA|nr:hypothetical protein [Sphingobacterium sp. SRCM116780]UIR57983.1 hypothetical protein LZQ00_09225 [Sphingobacterium sp. SRCM116780]
MKKIIYSGKFLLLAILFIFNSCKKDEPVHEHDNEEMKTMTMTFVEKTTNENVTVSIDATDKETKVLTLKKGNYDMTMKLYDFEGHEVQQEILDDANMHQFFFVGPSQEQINFTYLDAQVGLTSNWKILQAANNIPMKIVLMHGLSKGYVTPTDWNSKNYQSIAGGTPDIAVNLTLNLID